MDETKKVSPVSAVGIEAIKNRVRIKALVELLLKKGILTEEELNDQLKKVEGKYKEEYIKELNDQIENH